jgi:hypothetical protein
MAIPILPILRAIAPLLAASSGIAGSLGERAGQARNMASDDRIRKLEEDLLKMSQVVAGSVEQLQAAAQELRVQVDLNESRQKKLQLALMGSILAAVLSFAALIVAIAA